MEAEADPLPGFFIIADKNLIKVQPVDITYQLSVCTFNRRERKLFRTRTSNVIVFKQRADVGPKTRFDSYSEVKREREQRSMATSVDKLLGGGRKDNYVSSSDSDVDGEGEIPSTVVRPSADGLPQVGNKLNNFRLYFLARMC